MLKSLWRTWRSGPRVLRSAMTHNLLTHLPFRVECCHLLRQEYILAPCQVLGTAEGFWGIVQEWMPVLLPLQRTQQKLVHNIPQENELPHTSFTRSIGIDPTLPWSEFQRCRTIARCVFFFRTQIILPFHLVLWLFITDLLAQTKAN